jgi:tetratricopeptide (TPR) repeat protein
LAAGNWHWNWLISVFIAIALFAGRRKRPIILLAALISLFGCLPVLGMATSTFQYTSTTADHYLYFSMFGAAMALAWFLTAYPNTATRLLAAVALAACGILSFHQAGLWMDEQALWWHNLEVNPNSFVAYSDLGMMYARIGDNARAVTAFTREVQLHPNDDSARDDLANAFHEAGRLDDAILAKRQTLDLERGSPSLYTNWARHTAELGAFLCEAGRCNEALPYLKTAHAIAPHDAKVTWLLQRAATQAASTTPPETQPPSWP